MTITAELTLASRVLAPLLRDIYEKSSVEVAKRIWRWRASRAGAQVAQKLIEISKTKTILTPDESKSFNEFYYPCKLLDQHGHANAVNSLSDLKKRNIVIEGTVGQGKSVFLRFLSLQEITEASTGHIPIFVELRFLSLNNSSVKALVYSTLDNLRIRCNDDVFDYLASSGRLVLMLDGFDEVDERFVPNVIHELQGFATRYDSMQIVVTSRPDCAIQRSNFFHTVRIAPLLPEDYPGFLDKLKLSAVESHEIRDAIANSSHEMSALISTPLLLTLLVLVYLNERAVPQIMQRFFEDLFEVMFTRHDRFKVAMLRTRKCDISEYIMKQLFEAFSYMVMFNDYGRSFNSPFFFPAFKAAQECTEGSQCKAEDFRWDMTHVACLLIEEGRGFLTFLHKSVLEYHSSAYIKRQSDENAKEFYNQAAHNYWKWSGVLSFLAIVDRTRHAKFFLRPEIEKVLIALGAREYSLRGTPLRQAFFLYFCKGAKIIYALDRSKKLYVRQDKAVRSENFIIAHYLEHRLNASVDDTFPDSLELRDINAQLGFRRTEDLHKPAYELPLDRGIEIYGASSFDTALQIGVDELRVMRAELDEVIGRMIMQMKYMSRPSNL
ncbi:hypothetical protein BG58_33195 [Caballeronia jiangsuensis]|nr:hypothetical protein BG58_33195 [Caballeronia jiangsuensis]